MDLKGKSVKDNLKLGDMIANILAVANSNPSLAWQLGKKFATQEEVDLKAEDIVYIKEQIEANKEVFAFVKGQIIEILDGKVEEDTKKK